MSATLPRSTKKLGPKLNASSREDKKNPKCKTTRTAMSYSAGAEPVAAHHPWSGVGEFLLRPLPPDWRHNIQRFFADVGDALAGALGGAGGQRRSLGRRGF